MYSEKKSIAFYRYDAVKRMGAMIWVRELRYPMLLSGIALHLMLDIIMNLQFFSWIMICSLLLFIFPEDAAAFLGSVGNCFGD